MMGDTQHSPLTASPRKNIESHSHILWSFPCLVKTQRFQLAVSRRTPILSAVRPHPPAQPAGCGPDGRLGGCMRATTGRGRAVGYHQCPVTVTAPHTPRVAPFAPAGVRHLDGQMSASRGFLRLPPPEPGRVASHHPRLRRIGVLGADQIHGWHARAAYATPRPREAPHRPAALARGGCVPPPAPPCL